MVAPLAGHGFGAPRIVDHIASYRIGLSVTDTICAIDNFPNFRDFREIRNPPMLQTPGSRESDAYSPEVLGAPSLPSMIIWPFGRLYHFCGAIPRRSCICAAAPILKTSPRFGQISFSEDTHSGYKCRGLSLARLCFEFTDFLASIRRIKRRLSLPPQRHFEPTVSRLPTCNDG